MSGSTTRPGFFAGEEPPPLHPEGESSRQAARTIIGREIHRPALADPSRAPNLPASPQAPVGVPQTMTDETTDEIPRRPSHSGKSKFPALARLFGRWTTGGGFRARSGMSRVDDDLLNVPRDPLVSRVAMFVVAALLSFLVALAVLKVYRCSTSVAPSSVATQVSVSAAFPTPPVARAASPVLPAPPARPDPLAVASPTPEVAVPAARAAQAPAVRPRATHRSAQTVGGFSARGAPGVVKKLHAQPARPARPQREDPYKDALLPLGL